MEDELLEELERGDELPLAEVINILQIDTRDTIDRVIDIITDDRCEKRHENRQGVENREVHLYPTRIIAAE